jgi:hypothetical protein
MHPNPTKAARVAEIVSPGGNRPVLAFAGNLRLQTIDIVMTAH